MNRAENKLDSHWEELQRRLQEEEEENSDAIDTEPKNTDPVTFPSQTPKVPPSPAVIPSQSQEEAPLSHGELQDHHHTLTMTPTLWTLTRKTPPKIKEGRKEKGTHRTSSSSPANPSWRNNKKPPPPIRPQPPPLSLNKESSQARN